MGPNVLRRLMMSVTLVVALGHALQAPGQTPLRPAPLPDQPMAPMVAPVPSLQPRGTESPGRADLAPPVQPEFRPRYQLGVGLEDIVIMTHNGSGPFRAVRITWVTPGSAAAFAGLKPGDVIVWANQQHVLTPKHFQDAIARSGGTIHLSVIQAGTGQFVTLAPIRLMVYPVAFAPAPRSPTDLNSMRLTAPQTGTPTSSSDNVPGVGDSGESAPATYGSPPRQSVIGRFDDSVVIDPTNPRSELPSLPLFPWPPPRYSASTVVPDNLVHKAGANETLFDIAQRLEKGFRNAGYGQLGYYAVPKGFAMATRLEQFAQDGTPLPLPDRWSADVAPPPVFSLKSYFIALFGANPGHFRIVVLVVTSETITPDKKVIVTRDEASQWPSGGANRLPASFKKIPYIDDDYSCTALIYEFLQGGADDPPVLLNPGLDAETHLKKANIFRGLAP